jgi:hypothetical protein
MKKLFIAAAAIALAMSTAHASGQIEEYDCGSTVTVTVGRWHGKMWLSVSEDGKLVIEDKKFADAGIGLEEHPQKLNADVTDFRFSVELKGRTAVVHYLSEEEDNDRATTLDGEFCHYLGDPRYEREDKK